MTGSTHLRLVAREERPVVERLWQLYAHDMSEFRGSMPDDEGMYRPGRLPAYLDDPDDDRRCYLIRSGSRVAGFALVRGLVDEPRVAERRPVPRKPEIPPDTWLLLSTPPDPRC